MSPIGSRTRRRHVADAAAPLALAGLSVLLTVAFLLVVARVVSQLG